MSPFNAEILVVEDNRGDANLLREAFLENRSRSNLSFARDGMEALQFLRREYGFSQSQRPDLIVLDLKMPRMDGFSLLEEMKLHPSLGTIPVVILTGSDAESDKATAISLGARGYFIKPSKTDEWKKLAAKLEAFGSIREGY